MKVLKIFSRIEIALGWPIIFLRVSKSRVAAYIVYEIHQGCLTRVRHTFREFIWGIKYAALIICKFMFFFNSLYSVIDNICVN